MKVLKAIQEEDQLTEKEWQANKQHTFISKKRESKERMKYYFLIDPSIIVRHGVWGFWTLIIVGSCPIKF